MIAEIKRIDSGYQARFERQLTHTVDAVWSMLTDNKQLKRWFEELRVGELREGGFMQFNVPEVIYQELEISELKPLSVLEFDWFGDVIRFELYPNESGCELIVTEKISSITEQTKKDIAGWHVCLDVIEALLDEKTIPRDDEWRKWYERYAREIDELTGSNK
ncbi:MAG: SRPBCC domain-containing protein [Sporosarcina sp.]